MTPTIYVTNWQSIHADNRREAAGKPRLYSGPAGQHYTIMAKPRPQFGEAGDGSIRSLIPNADRLDEVKRGLITVDEYRRGYLRRTEAPRPGWLLAKLTDGHVRIYNAKDDPPITLACACSCAEAAAGRCHRVWSAGLLLEAGWRVVLDGLPLASVDAEGRPVFEGEAA